MQPRLILKYGIFVFLLILCGFFYWATIGEQMPMDADAAVGIRDRIISESGRDSRVLVVVGNRTAKERLFNESLMNALEESGIRAESTADDPKAIRRKLQQLDQDDMPLKVIVDARETTQSLQLLSQLGTVFPGFSDVEVIKPEPIVGSKFSNRQNLGNIADQISVIAIIAVGMTFVIIAGGIDLSVGSLIALSSVVAAVLIRDVAGGGDANVTGLILASLAGILACGLVGAFSGGMVIWMDIPPFIVTLAMMLVASGLAFILADGNSVPDLPASFTFLGRGSVIAIPLWGDIQNSVVLMLITYAVAWVILSRTSLGRYVYAVGDNRQAAWLSGVPVKRILLFTYALSGLLAGLGGIVVASKFQSGDPRYGITYELYVIAAVVVGGTSLTGGRGSVIGTLLGAFLIGVINNGMNLLYVTTYMQKVILGFVILGAVMLDRISPRH